MDTLAKLKAQQELMNSADKATKEKEAKDALERLKKKREEDLNDGGFMSFLFGGNIAKGLKKRASIDEEDKKKDDEEDDEE
jgi:hypothetical protein